MTPRARAWVAAGLCCVSAAWGEQTQNAGNGGTRTTTARLDFQVNIDRMIFFRVGAGASHGGGTSGTGPAPSGTVSAVGFNLGPTIIPGTFFTITTDGSNRTSVWNGVAPTFPVPADVVLPVEVRSNAGAVSITAQTTTPLANGGFLIPMSEISVVSSDTNLPAPPITDTGVGAAVSVATGGAGTGAAPTLLTYRTANWTFRYAPVTTPVAGLYTGQITFTASAP